MSLLALLHEGLLASHIWPHLGPYARAQLRATCMPLRSLADGLLGPDLQATLRAEVSQRACSEISKGWAWGKAE